MRDKENAEKERGGAIEKEKEQSPVLLSHLSVAGGEEQRKLVGCGVSHVCLTLSDSLLCYSVTHTLYIHSGRCVNPLQLSPLPTPF